MNHAELISPSVAVAISFGIFVLFVAWKRCFGMNKMIDGKIVDIQNSIQNAEKQRQLMHTRFQQIQSEFEQIDTQINYIEQQAQLECDTLIQKFKQDIQGEIQKKHAYFDGRSNQINAHYSKIVHSHLVDLIFDRVIEITKEKQPDQLFEQQLSNALEQMAHLRVQAA